MVYTQRVGRKTLRKGLQVDDLIRRILKGESSGHALNELAADIVFNLSPDRTLNELIDLYHDYDKISSSKNTINQALTDFGLALASCIISRNEGCRTAEEYLNSNLEAFNRIEKRIKSFELHPTPR